MNRRGNILDVIIIMAIIFILACGMMFFIFITKKVTGGLLATPTVSNTAVSNTIVSNVDTNAPWVLDFFVIMIMFGLPVLGMILAFFNNISPVWFWSTFGFTMLFVVLGGFFAAGYQNFITSGEISNAATYMPMTNFVMTYYIFYVLFVTIMISLGVYMKTQSQQGYQ